MRNLLWRGLALALAGCLSWLMWHWPAAAEPVEFTLDADCLHNLPQVLPTECILEGKVAKVNQEADGSILLTVEPERSP